MAANLPDFLYLFQIKSEEMGELLAEKARVAEEEAALLGKKASDAEEEIKRLRLCVSKVQGSPFLQLAGKYKCQVVSCLFFCGHPRRPSNPRLSLNISDTSELTLTQRCFYLQSGDERIAIERRAREVAEERLRRVMQEAEARSGSRD